MKTTIATITSVNPASLRLSGQRFVARARRLRRPRVYGSKAMPFLQRHRFFACSALGDAAPDRDDAPQPLPTPLLVERPVLWLLERQGLLVEPTS